MAAAVSAAPLGPLFVVGNSRSGTTMMGQILGRHPRVMTFNELHFIEEMWAPERDGPTLSEAQALALAARLLAIQRHDYLVPGDPASYRDEARAIVADLAVPLQALDLFNAFLEHELEHGGKETACDQTPRNVYFADLLLATYPNAHIIHMVRDPRDVLLSQKNRWKRRRLSSDQSSVPPLTAWANYHPITMSLLWKSGVRAALRCRDQPRFHSIRFEALVERPEATVRELCEQLGLDYRADMLEVAQVGSSLQRDEPSRIGIDAGAAGRFRSGGLSAAEIALSERVTAVQMELFGYQPTGAGIGGGAALLTLQWPLKTALSLLLNIRRSRNLLASIRRRLRG